MTKRITPKPPPVWLLGPDGKKFPRKTGETVAQALERRTRHLKKNQVVELAAKGWSIRRAVEFAGYHHSTIYRWIEEDPDFGTKLYQAVAGALGAVEEAGFIAAKAPEGHQDRKLIMRARGGYTFELPVRQVQQEDELDPKDVEIELVDGDGNPLL